MKNNEHGFDEMQKATRDKIGNQTFFIMSYLLMTDMVLHGIGLKWLSYPVNIMVIITVCMIYNLIRVILGNAYMPPEKEKAKPVFKSIALIIFAVALSAALGFSLMRSQGQAAQDNDHYAAVILSVVSAAGLLMVGVTSVIKEINNRNDDNEE